MQIKDINVIESQYTVIKYKATKLSIQQFCYRPYKQDSMST